MATTWVGSALVALGLALNITASRRFEAVGTPIRPGTRSTSLETGGVFAYSRNPMYLGMALILFGAALALGTATAFLVAPIFAVLIQRHFIVHEEAMLVDTFPREYAEYRDRVRRWV